LDNYWKQEHLERHVGLNETSILKLVIGLYYQNTVAFETVILIVIKFRISSQTLVNTINI